MKLLDDKTRILINLFLPQRRKPDPKHAIPEQDKNLSGKTIVFTGGTDGLGKVAVEMLYQMGANIVLLGRNKAKTEAVARELTETAGTGAISIQLCDLASMESVKACAERILLEHQQIDVLVNNAGVNMTSEIITADGFETNWAINYLGPHLFTELLLVRIKQTPSSRIVNLTTNTAFIKHIDFDGLQSKSDFSTDNTYVESKLSMNMYSIDLAEQLEGTDTTVNYLYPGYIQSNLLNDLKGAEKMMQFFMRVMGSPTVVGADRVVRLAISSEFDSVSGAYVREDDISPAHLEAQEPAKRLLMKRITDKALAKWR